MLKLNKFQKFKKRQGPLVLIIMDGIGIGKNNDGNAKYLARTPNLDYLHRIEPRAPL